MKRFHDRELSLLAAESLPELLSVLTDGLYQSFGLKTLSLFLHDPEHEIRHLLKNTGTSAYAFPMVHFTDDALCLETLYSNLKAPWLGPFLGAEHSPLFPTEQHLRSVALLPMLRAGKLVGSLNLGSQTPQRFTRHHGSDFLHRLATIAAVCLENAVNRERIVLTGLTDTLTGMHNRRYLEQRLEEEVARASRYRLPLSCLFVDADHFKRINDTHGHSTGDEVLHELAQRVRACLRASDLAVRYGGEEFALILPQTSAKEATHLAERIRLEIASAPISADGIGNPLHITVSIGVSEICPSPTDCDLITLGQRLIATADAALYEAKTRGRDRVVTDFNSRNIRTASREFNDARVTGPLRIGL